MPDRKKRIYAGACVLLLFAGVLGAGILVRTRPQPQRQRMPSMLPVVEVAGVSPVSTSVTIRCLGTVRADREVALQAEVGGKVVAARDGLVEGAVVREGDLLLSIDPVNYELAVAQAEASLHTAESSLRMEEGRQSAARHERSLIGQDTQLDIAYDDLMLREPQLKTARAAVDTARALLEKARQDLNRTQIRAPFDGVIRQVDAHAGDVAMAGRTLLRIAAVDRFFVQASLPISALSFFDAIGETEYPAEVILPCGNMRRGTLYRLLPDLSAQGRMARVLVAVERPWDEGARPLLLGEVVRVNLSGRPVDGAYRIERSALRDGPALWMLDGSQRLRMIPAEVIQGYDDDALVHAEFPPDWKLVVSDISAPVEGMKLQVQEGLSRGRECE